MQNLISPDLLHAISGFCVGLLVGMTGVGGGSLMTPLLILLFGVHPTTAVGTDLLFAASTKTVGTIVHASARTIDWRIVGLLAIGSVPATIASLVFLSHFDLGRRRGAACGHAHAWRRSPCHRGLFACRQVRSRALRRSPGRCRRPGRGNGHDRARCWRWVFWSPRHRSGRALLASPCCCSSTQRCRLAAWLVRTSLMPCR